MPLPMQRIGKYAWVEWRWGLGEPSHGLEHLDRATELGIWARQLDWLKAVDGAESHALAI
jgi:hypothetical protein